MVDVRTVNGLSPVVFLCEHQSEYRVLEWCFPFLSCVTVLQNESCHSTRFEIVLIIYNLQFLC